MKLFKMDYNDRRLYSLSFLLFFPILLDFITAFRGSPNAAVTVGLYGLSGAFILGWSARNVRLKNIMAIVIFMLLCLWSSVNVQNISIYFGDQGFLLTISYFFTISALVIFNIKYWDNFFNIFKWFAILGCMLAAYVVFFSNTVTDGDGEFFNYMEFSYGVLPCVLGAYVSLRQSRSIITLVGFLLGIAAIVSFGARAAVMYCFAFIVLYEFINKNISFGKIAAIVLLLVVVMLNFETIIKFLITLPIFQNSRLITHLIADNAFESAGRDTITAMVLNRISENGIEAPGFFGDRIYVNGHNYPHSIIYEMIMDWGWGIGIIMLGWMAWLIFKDYWVKKYHVLTAFIFFGIFARYFISGSYIIEGKFWMSLFMFLAISDNSPVLYPKKFVVTKIKNRKTISSLYSASND